MKKEQIAFAGFEGKDTQLLKLSRVACALYLRNSGDVPLLLQIGNDGRYYNEFIVYSRSEFRESLPSFTEILITPHPEEAEPNYIINASYSGYPYYRG